jgi:hypothetical protein
MACLLVAVEFHIGFLVLVALGVGTELHIRFLRVVSLRVRWVRSRAADTVRLAIRIGLRKSRCRRQHEAEHARDRE